MAKINVKETDKTVAQHPEKPIKYEFTEEKPTIVEEPLFRYEPLNLDASKRYTYADYLTWFDDVRRELIGGLIHLMSAPVRIHQHILSTLSNLLSTFIRRRKGKCYVYFAPFDVRFPKNNATDDDKVDTVVQPDICVICDRSKLDDKGCIGAPDLMVEVLSPSSIQHDYKTKFDLYEEVGVREYWIVDPKAKTVHVFVLQPNGKYNKGTIYNCTQKAPVHIFEGLKIDLKVLFEDL
jgi:Uma2 family endonuclease